MTQVPKGGHALERLIGGSGTVLSMSEGTGSTLLNALIGAVATFIFSFTMVSPVLGGALAGYLEGDRGIRVGAISGLMAVAPLVLLAFLMMGVLSIGMPAFAGAMILLFGVILIPLYVVGLSALGGYLGVYLRTTLGASK